MKPGICLEGGALSVDGSVLDKPFTDPDTTELVAISGQAGAIKR